MNPINIFIAFIMVASAAAEWRGEDLEESPSAISVTNWGGSIAGIGPVGLGNLGSLGVVSVGASPAAVAVGNLGGVVGVGAPAVAVGNLGGVVGVGAPALAVGNLGGRVGTVVSGVNGPVAVGGLRGVGLVSAAGPLVSNALNGPLVNTVAALNSGSISDANTAGIRVSNSLSAAGQAAANDANNLARQIAQQAQTNRDGAIQAAIDQSRHLRNLNSIIHAEAVRLRSNAAQSQANQAAVHSSNADNNLASVLNRINGGSVRDAALIQSGAIGHVGRINSNAALAAQLNQVGAVVGTTGQLAAVGGGLGLVSNVGVAAAGGWGAGAGRIVG